MMKLTRTDRGFEEVEFRDSHGVPCGLAQSSAVGHYDDALSRPGSSYVWLGRNGGRMHLGREQVAELVMRLTNWLGTGSLETRDPRPGQG